MFKCKYIYIYIIYMYVHHEKIGHWTIQMAILRWWRNAAHTRRQKTPIEIWRQDCSQSFSRKSDRFSHMSRPPPQIRSQISHRSSHRSLRTSQISHRFWSQISHRFLTDFWQTSHSFLPTHGWRKSVRNLWFSLCFWIFGGCIKQLGFLVIDLKLRFYLVN